VSVAMSESLAAEAGKFLSACCELGGGSVLSCLDPAAHDQRVQRRAPPIALSERVCLRALELSDRGALGVEVAGRAEGVAERGHAPIIGPVPKRRLQSG
jgi:hypothetical protein